MQMSPTLQFHLMPISRFTAMLLLFVFTTSLLMPCDSMATAHEQGEGSQLQVQNHHHDIEVMAHCDDASATESSQLALLSVQNDHLTKPAFQLQPLYWLDLNQQSLLVGASMQGALLARHWASSISTSSNSSLYLASFRRQLI